MSEEITRSSGIVIVVTPDGEEWEHDTKGGVLSVGEVFPLQGHPPLVIDRFEVVPETPRGPIVKCYLRPA